MIYDKDPNTFKASLIGVSAGINLSWMSFWVAIGTIYLPDIFQFSRGSGCFQDQFELRIIESDIQFYYLRWRGLEYVLD